MLEATQHEGNSFVTLTYDDEHLPEGHELRPKDLSSFLKRLRKSIYPLKIRYFGVGEYGEQTKRPHYHLALFGYQQCEKGVTRPNRSGYCCDLCDRVQRNWAMGNIYSGGLETTSAAYIAGYVTKKLTNPDDPRLEGKHPEFARMSLKPGIGSEFTHEIANTLLTHRLDTPENIPTHLRHGSTHLPLGRYLRRHLVARTGLSQDEVTAYGMAKAEAKMSPLREAATAQAPAGSKMFAFKQALIDEATGKIIQIEAKNKPKKGIL